MRNEHFSENTMSITGIQHNTYISQLTPLSSSVQPGFSGGDGDGDGGVGSTGGSSTFSSALTNALSQSGISTSGNNQAMQAFMQQLLAALQAQSGQGAQFNGAHSDGDNDGSSSASAVNGISRGQGHHHGGIGKMESNLQSLIQQLSSSSTSSTAANSPDAALQQSFQSLLNTQGSSTNQTTLAGFLQTLSQNLQGAGMVGNNVNTLG
jgi:hypothetical protein